MSKLKEMERGKEGGGKRCPEESTDNLEDPEPKKGRLDPKETRILPGEN